jgi:hypothetical protein
MRAHMLSILVMLLVLSGPVAAANFSADLRHTILARQALRQDARLAPFNVGVRVQNRVAVLWGSVPSAELAQRAENVLRKLPDLVHVRSELHIEGDHVVLSPGVRPGFLPEQASGPVSPSPRAELPVIGGITVVTGAATPGPNTPLCVHRPFTPPGVLMTWPNASQTPTAPSENVRPAHAMLGPETPAPRPKTLHETVVALQQSKEAFGRLELVVSDAVVTVRGSANDPATHEFARLLARLPGVERVILREP